MSMKVISTLAISAFVTLLTACAMQTPIQRPVFPEAEYQRLELSGSGSVSGQVFMRTVGGDVKYGAGSNVFLFPDTTYSEFWYQRSYIEQKALTPPDEPSSSHSHPSLSAADSLPHSVHRILCTY